MRTAITTNEHDDGFELVAGDDITGQRFGRIYYADGGLCLVIDAEDDAAHEPDCVKDAVAILAGAGWDLTEESVADITRLAGSGTP